MSESGGAMPLALPSIGDLPKEGGDARWRAVAMRFPWMAAPAALFYLVFFGYPLIHLVVQSVWINGALDFSNYRAVISDPLYLRVLGYTALLGLVTLAITLLIAYPVAYWLVSLRRSWTVILMAFVMIPFWSSGLVRTYAWIVLLGRRGVVNRALIEWGVLTRPMAFVGTHTAVIVGLTYYLMPYMILCLYSVMNGIDRSLLLAAGNLGASPARAFFHVFVPLTKPGIFAGSYLVFMLAIGMYITPALLGGPRQTTLPLLIAIQVNEALDWSLAATLAVMLLVITGLVQLIVNRKVSMDRMWGGAR